MKRSSGKLRVFAALLAMAASATATSGAAQAGAPTVVPINLEFVDDFNCSFPMNVTLVGVIRDRVDGNVTKRVWSSSVYTWTNPANGKSVSGPSNGPETFTANPDGSATLDVRGVVYNVTVKNSGKVLQVVGHIILHFPADPTQPVVFEVVGGKNQSLSNLCPYLAD